MKTNFIFIFVLVSATIVVNPLLSSSSSQKLIAGLPTVVVRGFLNYMTIVDGVVIKFTKSSGPTQAASFPVLLIPSSVDSTAALVKPTDSTDKTEFMVMLNKNSGQLHVSEKQQNLIKPSSSMDPSATDTILNYPSNSSDPSMSASDKLRMRMNRFKVRGADSDQLYDICLKDVCVRGKIPDSVLLIGKHKQTRTQINSGGVQKENKDSEYRPPLPRWRRKFLRKRVGIHPSDNVYIETQTFTRTIKSKVLSTISIVRDGSTRNHIITDHFFMTELVTAHKIMPKVLRTVVALSPSNARAIEPTPVPSSLKMTSLVHLSDYAINPVDYLVGLDVELSSQSSEANVYPSPSKSPTPPLPLPPPNQMFYD